MRAPAIGDLNQRLSYVDWRIGGFDIDRLSRLVAHRARRSAARRASFAANQSTGETHRKRHVAGIARRRGSSGGVTARSCAASAFPSYGITGRALYFIQRRRQPDMAVDRESRPRLGEIGRGQRSEVLRRRRGMK